MRILFLTDSLSLPRKYDVGEVTYEDTYIFLLRKKYPEILIVDVAIGGAKIADLLTQCFYYKQFNPELVFLQCGIVDCAPRSYTIFEMNVINKLRLGRVSKLFAKNIRLLRDCTYTNKKSFKNHLASIKNYFDYANFYSVGILRASDEYEKKLPGIKKKVKEYNCILKEYSNFINNDDFPLDRIISDHHHLNEKGHLLMFEKLSEIISCEYEKYELLQSIK